MRKIVAGLMQQPGKNINISGGGCSRVTAAGSCSRSWTLGRYVPPTPAR
jgi:hypothetical protein